MLKALETQLRKMADVSTDKLRKEISNRFETRATDEQVHAVKEFIFLMPPALRVLSQYWSDKKTPHEAKNLAGLIITYVYHPQDLLSEEEYGLFGYLDDAYLVIASYLKIQKAYIRNWDDKSEMERDLDERAKKLINTAQIIIPNITERIDKIIDDWYAGKTDNIGVSLNVN